MCYLVDEKQMGKKVMNKILGSNMTDVTSRGVCVWGVILMKISPPS